jgi:hypothetical protein
MINYWFDVEKFDEKAKKFGIWSLFESIQFKIDQIVDDGPNITVTYMIQDNIGDISFDISVLFLIFFKLNGVRVKQRS